MLLCQTYDLDLCSYIYVITISKSINTCMFYCSLYTNCMQHAICCYTYYICRSQERIAHKSFNAVNWGMWYWTENNWICSQSDKLAKHSSAPWSHFFYYDKRRNGKGYPFANVKCVCHLIGKTFWHLDEANSIETALRTCN